MIASRALCLLALLLPLMLSGCDSQDDLEASLDEAIEASPYPQGAVLYERQCRACHQMDGSGHGRAFPPLADHVPSLVAADGGRDYLIQLTLYGIGGEIEVLGERYGGVMPGFRRMNDEQIAAVLNHVSHAWGGKQQLPDDFEAFQPEEIARQREERLSPNQVWQRRPDL